MPELDLHFVGTGNAFAEGGLCWNGFLLDGRYLFEAPPQALQALKADRIDSLALDAVILSHHHGDHFLGLPFLILDWKRAGRTRPVRIVGPYATRELAMNIGTAVYPGLFETPFEIQWEELSSGDRTAVGDLRLGALAVKHDVRLRGTLGFEISLAGRRIAYTGDTALCDAVFSLAAGAEVLVSECASISDLTDFHMNLRDDIPVVRSAMPADSKLILTHLGQGVDAAGLKNTIIAQDHRAYRI